MRRDRPSRRQASRMATLLAVCVVCVLSAEGADESLTANPVNLDSTIASRLLKKDDPPVYPPLAKINYIQGMVRLRVCVSREGRVSEVHVVAGHPFLAASALQAVRKWVYRPYRVGKRAVEFWTLIDFHFSLRSKTLIQMPPQAENDLRERVTPPEILQQAADPPNDDHVRIRVLVDAEGSALDDEILSGDASQIREAEEEISHWKFRPARWGALPVPWYLVVEVPVR